MGDEFYRTIMGERFYEGTMPRMAVSLQRIAQELKRSNDRQEPPDNEAWVHALLQLRKAVFADEYIDSGEDIETIISRIYQLAGMPVPKPLDPWPEIEARGDDVP